MTILETLEKASEGIIESYKTDLQHDLVCISEMEDNEYAIWYPYDCGSYLIRITSPLNCKNNYSQYNLNSYRKMFYTDMVYLLKKESDDKIVLEKMCLDDLA